MPLSSRKGHRRNNPAPFILFGLVFYLLLSDGVLAETVQKLSLEEFTREADVIVRGRIRPKLVAQIEFTEWTPDGHLRHSSFSGLREDKEAREIVCE
jgi:ATP-dependent DNA ligase